MSADAQGRDDERISEWSESDELLRWTLEQHTKSLNDAGERCAICYTRIPCDIASLAASGLHRSARLAAAEAALTRIGKLARRGLDMKPGRTQLGLIRVEADAALAGSEPATTQGEG